MTVTHPTVKAPGQPLAAVVDWNASHIIDGSTGEILFREAGGTIGTDTGLFWDDVNKRLAVGTQIPASTFQVDGAASPDIRVNASGGNPTYRLSESGTTRATILYSIVTNTLLISSSSENADIAILPHGSGRVGIGAAPTAASALLELTSTTGALLLTRMTTGERDALTAVNGMILYNSTTNKIEGYEAGAWVDI